MEKIINFITGVKCSEDMSTIISTNWLGRLICEMAVKDNHFIKVDNNRYKLNKSEK